jgi:hypothetical protein
MTNEELKKKFNILASVRLDSKDRDRLFHFVNTIDEQESLEGLWDILLHC